MAHLLVRMARCSSPAHALALVSMMRLVGLPMSAMWLKCCCDSVGLITSYVSQMFADR